MKPGYKTTEFWGKNIAIAGAVITALAGGFRPEVAAMISAFAEGCYAVSRGLTKAGDPGNLTQ